MLTYVGKGYSPAFTANYDKVIARMVAGEAIVIQEGPDEICRPLMTEHEPHCLRDSVVERDAKAAIDVGKLLGKTIAAGERIVLDGAVLDTLREAFRDGQTRSACAGCEWFDLCSSISRACYADTRLRLG